MANTKTENKKLKSSTIKFSIARKGFIIASLLILSFVVVACTQSGNNPSTTGTTSTSGTNQNQNSGKTKFSDSAYASSSYLISGDTLDSGAKMATAGFNIQKTTLPDGSLQISLTSTNPEYKNQTYTLTAGQKLYFIETNPGDDSGTKELNLRDDSAIIVDADGYIVN
jgi:hypothetical protein